MSYEADKALLVNRLNGSRLAVGSSSLSDGAPVVSVRFTSHDNNPQRWSARQIGEEEDFGPILLIEISDDDNTFRLDAGTTPEVSTRQIRIRKPDESDRQKWCFRTDWYGTELSNIAPYTNLSAGLSLRDDFGHTSHDEVVLVRNFSSCNQLWYWNRVSYGDIIPN